MNYYAFDNVGNIVRRGNYTEETKHLYIASWYTLVTGEADIQRNFMLDGCLREYTEEQIQAKATPPGFGRVWIPSLGRWVDQRSLQELKIAKNTCINTSWLKANQTSFTFAGQSIAVDSLSRSVIETTNGVVLLTKDMPPGWQGGWKTLTNSYVKIANVADWTEFYLSMNMQGVLNFTYAQKLKTQLAAARTTEEVNAIVW